MAPVQSKIPFSKGSPFKRNSPGKNSSKLAKRPQHVLSCYGFPPSPVEFYILRKGEDRDGYTGFYRQVIDGEKENDALAEHGFFQYFTRRVSLEQDIPMVGQDTWNCTVMVRYVNGMNPSSTSTRYEGLTFLRGWLMDKNHSKYPPNDILTVDQTRGRDILAMDNFILDEHVLLVMEAVISEDLRNERFFTDFREYANVFYTGPDYPSDAIAQYGFGNQLPQPDNGNANGENNEEGPGNNADVGNNGDNAGNMEENNVNNRRRRR